MSLRYLSLNNKFNSNEKIILILFVYVFFFAIIQSVKLPNFFVKFSIDFLLILVFLAKPPKHYPGIRFFLLFFAFFLFSTIINFSDIYHSLTFFRIFLYPYLIFIYIYNSGVNYFKHFKIVRFVSVLFLAQIIGGIYKYFVFGITEKRLIGFISTDGGAYSTMLPLFAICFLIALYLIYARKTKYILLIFGFLFIGFVGAKRAIWLYFPFLVLIAWYVYLKIENRRIDFSKKLGTFILIGTMMSVVFVLGVKYNRTLNPDKVIGGSFDFDFVREYAMDYTFSENYYGQSQGRGSNFITILEQLQKSPVLHFLFGYGPDTLKGASTYGEGIWEEFNINGPVTGLTGKLVQLGVLANLLLLFLMYHIGKIFYQYAKIEQEKYWKALSFGGCAATILFFIDYLTYSSSFFSTIFAISFPFSLLFGIIYYRYRALKTQNG